MGDSDAGRRPLLEATAGGDGRRRTGEGDAVGVLVLDDTAAADSDQDVDVGPAWDGFVHTSEVAAQFPAPLKQLVIVGAPDSAVLQGLLVFLLLARFVAYTALAATGNIRFLATYWMRTLSGITSGIAAVWIRHRRLTHQVSIGDTVRDAAARKRFKRSLLFWGAGIMGATNLALAFTMKYIVPLVGQWVMPPALWARQIVSALVYLWEICSIYYVVGIFTYDCSCVQRLRRHVADELNNVLLSPGSLANKLDGATRLHEALRKTTRVLSSVYSLPILLFVLPVFCQGLTGYIEALLLHSGSKAFGVQRLSLFGAFAALSLVAVETMVPLLWVAGGMALANSREGLSESTVFSAMRGAAHREDSSSLGLEWGLLLDYLRSRRNTWRLRIAGWALGASDMRRLSASFALSLVVLVARRSLEYGSQPSGPSPGSG